MCVFVYKEVTYNEAARGGCWTKVVVSESTSMERKTDIFCIGIDKSRASVRIQLSNPRIPLQNTG